MAKEGVLWIAVDVNFWDEHAEVDTDSLAFFLHMIGFCRRANQPGTFSLKQARAAWGRGYVGVRIKRLVAAGLLEVEGGKQEIPPGENGSFPHRLGASVGGEKYVFPSWSKWNKGGKSGESGGKTSFSLDFPPKTPPLTRENAAPQSRAVQKKQPSVVSRAAKSAAKAEQKPRPRDFLFEAIAEECYGTWKNLTPAEATAVGTATSELRTAGATPEQVPEHCARYRAKWSGIDLTPRSLVKHWHTFREDATVTTPASSHSDIPVPFTRPDDL